MSCTCVTQNVFLLNINLFTKKTFNITIVVPMAPHLQECFVFTAEEGELAPPLNKVYCLVIVFLGMVNAMSSMIARQTGSGQWGPILISPFQEKFV